MGAGRRKRTAEAERGHAGARRAAPPPPRQPPARGRAAARGGALAWRPPDARLEGWLGAAWVLGAVLAFGLALRLAHLLALGESPFFGALALDARYYDSWARAIAGGRWVGEAAFWVDPLYAYLLGGVYRVLGHDLLWARLINLACGLASAWLVAHIARRVWDSRAAAALAALGAVAFIPTIYFEGQTEKTAVTVLLITAALALFLRGTRRALFAAGVVLGLAALARGNALLFAPFAAACLLLGWERDAPRAPLPARGARAALLLAGLLPVVGLATLHNWLAVGALVPTTTNLGINLYLGNHAGNAYGRYTPPDFLRSDTGHELPDFHAEAQRRLGRPLSDVELSTYWRGEALAALGADPGLAVQRTASKLFFVLNDAEIPDNEDVEVVAEWSPVLRAPLLWMGTLLPFAVLGAVVGWRRRGVRLIAAMAAIYIVSLLPFFVMSRLRIQLVPLLCVLAGGALVWLASAALARRSRALAAAAALLVPVAVLANYRSAEMVAHRRSGQAIAWNNLGSGFVQSGQTEPAIAAYERAVAIDANAVPVSLRALADLHRARGDLAAAEAALRHLVQVRPQSGSARAALRDLYAAMVADPRWRDDAALRDRAQRAGAVASPAASAAAPAPPAPPSQADAAIARARALARQGRTADAIRALQDAVRNGPYDENLHYVLGETMAKHAAPAELVEFWSAEAARDEKPQTSHYYSAVGLARGGDVPGAIAQLRQALAIDPAHEMSQRQWGLLLEQQGEPDAALEHLLEATRIHPDFKAAWEDAARVAAAQGRVEDAARYRQRAAEARDSDRRYLHWARYLVEHRRYRAAWVELHHLLRVQPTDADALALRERIRPHLDAATLAELAAATPVAAAAAAAPVAAAAAGAPLDATARAALLARLRDGAGATAWISYDGRDAGAQRLAADLAATFRAAGWQVATPGPVGFPLRAGLFVFVAEAASPSAETVTAALDAAGLPHTYAAGYREFSDERRRADPNWRGVALAPGQEFSIVVGRAG